MIDHDTFRRVFADTDEEAKPMHSRSPAKERASEQVSADVQDYLANGGEIKPVGNQSQGLTDGHWQNNNFTINPERA